MKKIITIIVLIILMIVTMSKEEEVIIPKDAIRFRVIANSNDLKDQQEKKKIAKTLKVYGFTYVTLDLMGYRTGSMNETL